MQTWCHGLPSQAARSADEAHDHRQSRPACLADMAESNARGQPRPKGGFSRGHQFIPTRTTDPDHRHQG